MGIKGRGDVKDELTGLTEQHKNFGLEHVPAPL